MKKIHIKQFLFFCLIFFLVGKAQADQIQGKEKRVGNGFRTAEACTPPSANAQLNINNVRCALYNGGDMWWDLVGNPRYEIPKGGGKHSLFAASLWIGGTDAAGQMRVAAQTYRQDGYDFWPGPLTQGKAEIDNTVCDNWNKMYVITKAEIDKFRATGEMSPAIKNWPALGNAPKDIDGNDIDAALFNGKEIYAAPFVDANNNLIYDPASPGSSGADYPLIKGDQAVYWIINDKGNVHTATQGQPIGVELHIMAFAFTTSNAVNNMTFYDQLVINRSSLTLTNTYMGQWVDADLGYYKDDFVGCDTARGLGYVWNSDNDDNLPNGYGANPPSVGVDFFQGPLADPGDLIDNDKDGTVDEEGEQIIMSKFVYYNNDFSLKGNPETATHYYNYLRGIWKDGTQMVNNGKDAYAATAAGSPTNYIFPGSVCNQTGWIEGPGFAGTAPDDRRFLQSAGPFTLQAGAVNEIITGVVWARGSSNTNSVCELLIADDVAQALFDNNFRLLEGPDAPEVDAGEFDESIVLSWGYPDKKTTNNYNESYVQADPVLKARNIADSIFRFQGYMIYQLSDNTVELNDLSNPEKAQLVAQCDIVDDVATIKNSTSQNVDGQIIVNDVVMVRGENKGIFHSVKITQDLFATDQYKNLKNYTPYYFAVVAYAYNDVTSDGRQFVLGNSGFSKAKVTVLPHANDFENGGSQLNSTYGEGIPITQVGGYGNGGNFVKISAQTEAKILSNYSVNEIMYEQGYAPIKVKVVDPTKLKNLDYVLKVTNNLVPIDSIILYKNTSGVGPDTIKDYIYTDWQLYEAGNATPIYVAKYYKRNDGTAPRPAPLSGNEQVIMQEVPNGSPINHGFSVAVTDVKQCGIANFTAQPGGGLVGSSLTFSDPNQAWFTGIKDDDSKGDAVWNWILAGPTNSDQKVGLENRVFKSAYVFDSTSTFETVIGGTWSPFCFAREFLNGVGGENPLPGVKVGTASTNFQLSAAEVLGLNEISDIELVITPDETQWTRCVVVETSSNTTLGAGSWLLSGKWKANVDKKGNPETAGPQVENHGLGWFPGYAYNVNTGQRLCVFFGEAEFDHLNHGDDMMFNPTSSFGPNLDRVGGRHYIYVTDLPYTGENGQGMDTLKKYLQNNNWQNAPGTTSTDALLLADPSDPNNQAKQVHLRGIYSHVQWTTIGMAGFGYSIEDPHDFPSEARVSIRVNQAYKNQSINGSTETIPTFTFNTKAVSTSINQNEIAKSALDMINVVPNPYYAYSAYENGQLESIVKITNLPQKCTISIYSLNGQIIKTYTKDSNVPEQEWDLKNEQGVPAASGVYIVHINAPGIGEKVVKMLAVMRQLDLNGY